MAPQRLVIVGALVAEKLMEALKAAGIVADQPIPVVVAELVAEMAEQRAVVLAHLGTHLLAFGGIGLGDVERDQAVVVAGQHMLARGRVAQQRIGEEIEGDADLVAGLAFGPTGKPKASSE